ncbi:hypothetical protein EB232_32115 [Mesorhizobium sp. NZP2077]|nr:hypothetical protein EB232_32115 [Mesorhizobium sp. NZP2077]
MRSDLSTHRPFHFGQDLNRYLFMAADFLARPPGFYVMMIASASLTPGCTAHRPARMVRNESC